MMSFCVFFFRAASRLFFSLDSTRRWPSPSFARRARLGERREYLKMKNYVTNIFPTLKHKSSQGKLRDWSSHQRDGKFQRWMSFHWDRKKKKKWIERGCLSSRWDAKRNPARTIFIFPSSLSRLSFSTSTQFDTCMRDTKKSPRASAI